MPSATERSRAIRDVLDAYDLIVGCISSVHIVHVPARADLSRPRRRARRALEPGEPFRVQSSEPIPLRHQHGGALDMTLAFRHTLRWSASGGVEIVDYEHRFLDRAETELLVWHDQAGPDHQGPDYPHLHVSATMTARTPAGGTTAFGLDKVHVPTGHVRLAAVVRTLIEEFGAAARDDWQIRLERAERRLASAGDSASVGSPVG